MKIDSAEPSWKTESIWIQCLKVILLSLSAFGYTWPLVTGAGHAAVIAAVAVAAIAASTAMRVRLRPIWCIFISILFIAVGFTGSFMTLNVFGASDIISTINVSRFWYYSGLVFGIVFLTRSLSLRYRPFALAESCLIIGTLVFLFFAHRDFNLTSPREFADYLYGSNYDPIEVYRWMGIGAAFLALPMLFRRVKFLRAVSSIALLALLALLASMFIGDSRLPVAVEDPLGIGADNDEKQKRGGSSDDDENEDNQSGSDQNDDDNNSGKNNDDNQGPTGKEEPQPVAVAVFYDEFEPGDGIFHFRQTVLSQYDGNHLVSSDMDTDVISQLPIGTELNAEPLQNPNLHTKISTSMFLIKEHSQPPQIAMGQRLFPIQNPDPKLFVSAYGVESYGLSLNTLRLIGRRSIPVEWPQEKVQHYTEIPDDPRYKALSDIIIRQIDPRFIGDDIVKALYIKSWLEKEGYYTMKTKHIDNSDPTASFLFGSLRGYCVHFAHSAVFLLRSQGIAARVALGYAVDNNMRGTNSAVLILGNQAHAWPEMYVDGVGWVTLEIFPENGDEPPRAFVDQSLESLFGELARDDKSGGKAPKATSESFQMPWRSIWLTLLRILAVALMAAYIRKGWILVSALKCSTSSELYRLLRGTIFVWAMYGRSWRKYKTLEEFAEKEAGLDSATRHLIIIAAAPKLGVEVSGEMVSRALELYRESHKEAAAKTKWFRRVLGWINPFVII